MAVEKSGVGNFKFDKQITNNVSTDLEAIGVSENGQNLVKALSSTRFRGLTSDYSFVDDQLQSLAFQIVNVNGYGTRGIGFWTPEKRILMKKFNKGFCANEEWYSTTNKPTVIGYCIDVFDAVMKTLPYAVTYEYIPFGLPDGSRNLRPEPEAMWYRDKVPVVDLEMAEDSLEEEHGPLNKRSKLSSTTSWSGCDGSAKLPIPPSQYNLLDQSLQLRKSPSLLDSIQSRISQGDTALTTTKKESSKATTGKLKASNFCASILRIGSWEYKPRYEGDLVAQCYFAKKKLVWEVIGGGLKRKIEIQWSDIMALKANMPEDGLGTLNVVLARRPLFFREINPRPKKHTLWQDTADFTDGQASKHKQHFMQCPQGLLNKTFENLIQCDMRLNFLSQQPDMIVDSPYFGYAISSFQNLSSPAATLTHSLEHIPREAPSPMNDIGHYSISQQMTCGNQPLFEQGQDCPEILRVIAQCLLSDTQLTMASDEKSLMSRVNSFGCLLHKEPDDTAQNLQVNVNDGIGSNAQLNNTFDNKTRADDTKAPECDTDDVSNHPIAGMSRENSFGELLFNLPRITSLPKLLS
ncbi:hypothetical protein QYF36_001703 [Acer negundo]|nr:hypothetical protein QYF36_001703 [Acer negundo]